MRHSYVQGDTLEFSPLLSFVLSCCPLCTVSLSSDISSKHPAAPVDSDDVTGLIWAGIEIRAALLLRTVPVFRHLHGKTATPIRSLQNNQKHTIGLHRFGIWSSRVCPWESFSFHAKPPLPTLPQRQSLPMRLNLESNLCLLRAQPVHRPYWKLINVILPIYDAKESVHFIWHCVVLQTKNLDTERQSWSINSACFLKQKTVGKNHKDQTHLCPITNVGKSWEVSFRFW